ncbi:hypothetical protein [Frateuria soli]|uniref:hypothetical protein n=1 Tax=Frateuria soli TaxID=1542730 RepID=UPI001E5E01A7|nr:hypothetical protein [Frateuria soli]UGB38618.1 hypothetical protein LQ771_01825 [Frateuria soli]
MSRQQSPGSQSSSNKNQHPTDTIDGARGKLSVREAGRKGGLRVRELINRGRQVEARQSEQRPN